MREQYINFLEQNYDELTSLEKNISFLIFKNFDSIKKTKIQYGNRSQLIANLINKHIDEPSQIPDLFWRDSSSLTSSQSIKRIKKLDVENFKGFKVKNTFIFDKKYTLVYGPNGTGKSSFCNALEFGILGYIKEAESRRFEDNDFGKNEVLKKFAKPKIYIEDSFGNEVEFNDYNKEYEFGFIEKNRIDSFSRVSATTPKEQENRLATLFGLDEFNEFVSHFPKKIDTQLVVKTNYNEQLMDIQNDIDNKKNLFGNYKNQIEMTQIELEQKLNESSFKENTLELSIIALNNKLNEQKKV